MRQSVVLLLVCLMGIVYASCPSDCNGHGDCHGSVCRCHSGYGGDDCSIDDTELVSGVSATGSLASFHWHYYHIDVSAASGLMIEVNQTSNYGDVDVYIQHDDYPTQHSYLDKDIYTDKQIILEEQAPADGLWYIGLYGYWNVQYAIRVTVQRTCIVDCGEHGHCQSNRCLCDQDWTGDTCDIFERAIHSGDAPYHNTVGDRQWQYYTLSVPSGDAIDIQVNEPDEATDVDIYIKAGSRPNFFNFDAMNSTLESLTVLEIPEKQETTVWYIGCFGYQGGAYTIQVTESTAVCSSECSGHGTCQGRRCQCREGFSGSSCEMKNDPIGIDDAQDGVVSPGYFNYYVYQGATENDIVVSVQTHNDGDCDVFIKENAQPSPADYDYSDLSYDNPTEVIIRDPSLSEWYIGIYGWTRCEYTLTMSEPQCDCASDSHGHCATNSDICICDNNWAGDKCTIRVQAISDGEVLSTETVKKNVWKYYKLTVHSSAVLISLKEKRSIGNLWLFASLAGYPNLDTYDYGEQGQGDLHEIHISFREFSERTIYIGVYGSPFIIDNNMRIPFEITAWGPPF